MKLLGLVALTTGIAANNQIAELQDAIDARATVANFGKSRKANAVKSIAKRLTKKWKNKLVGKLHTKGCWDDFEGAFWATNPGCGIRAVQHTA
mgnify:CR=1 FL=1